MTDMAKPSARRKASPLGSTFCVAKPFLRATPSVASLTCLVGDSRTHSLARQEPSIFDQAPYDYDAGRQLLPSRCCICSYAVFPPAAEAGFFAGRGNRSELSISPEIPEMACTAVEPYETRLELP